MFPTPLICTEINTGQKCYFFRTFSIRIRWMIPINIIVLLLLMSLHEKCPYLQCFWSQFPHIKTYMEIYAVFGLNADQNLRIRLILRSVISFQYLMDLSFAGRPSEISSFRPPVCNTVFSGLTQYFCLIFCMKLEISKKIKVTKTTF